MQLITKLCGFLNISTDRFSFSIHFIYPTYLLNSKRVKFKGHILYFRIHSPYLIAEISLMFAAIPFAFEMQSKCCKEVLNYVLMMNKRVH